MFKKTIAVWLLLLLVSGVAFAEVEKIKDYIRNLESKLAAARKEKDLARVRKLEQLLRQARERLEREMAAQLVPPEAAQPAEVKAEAAKKEIEKKPETSVGGVIFFRWQKGLQNATLPNNFDVERAYLDFKRDLDANANVRVTLDVARLDTSKLDTSKKSQQLFDYLKYAYVDLKEALPSLNLRLGLQPTYWIDFVDKILGIRYVAKNLTDNEGVLTSADFGVGGLGKFNLAGLPAVEYQATVLNGTGYKAAETDGAKTVGLRLNSEIYPEVTVALGSQVPVSSSGTGNKVINALAAYKTKASAAYFEYLYGTGISGYSLGGIYEILSGIKIFGRLDNYDPDRSVANNQIDRQLAGVSYDWGKNVKLALDYQSASYGSAASSNAGKTVSYIYLHTLVVF